MPLSGSAAKRDVRKIAAAAYYQARPGAGDPNLQEAAILRHGFVLSQREYIIGHRKPTRITEGHDYRIEFQALGSMIGPVEDAGTRSPSRHLTVQSSGPSR